MFSKTLENTLNLAFSRAKEKRHEFITVEHLLLALTDNPEASAVLTACGANLTRLRNELGLFIDETTPYVANEKELKIQSTLGFQRVLQRAIFQVQSSGKKEVNGANVLVAIFNEQESQAVYFLSQENVTRLDVMNYISHGISKLHYAEDEGDHGETGGSADSLSGEHPHNNESVLDRFAVNLNEEARRGKIDPLVGRDLELSRMIQVLCRRHKNNPLLVGEAGVGKTAIVEGLATRIVTGQVPELIANATLYSLDLGGLLAGTKYRGDFEKRFKAVLKALQEIENAIIFVDEIHTIIGAGSASGGAMDAANLLKPLLVNSKIKCVGATTYREYRSIFEKDHALTRRFQKIDVAEPSVQDTIEILKGLKPHLEKYHEVRFTPQAIVAAVELADRHIGDRHLPDKAIDVLDEAGAFQRLQPLAKRRKNISEKEIESIVAMMARVPTETVSSDERRMLANLERDLKMLVFGQNAAIDVLVASIKMAYSGLRTEEKPIGSFLLEGPTGVGKTEVAKQLAKLLGIQLVRFDMSEYMERHTVSRLIGAPPGYVGHDEGGLLTEAINKQPHAVLLLDEIEKAHPDVYNVLLQVMDYGKLTDSNGRVTDFQHVILIMTTNAGADELDKNVMGFTSQGTADRGLDAIKRQFSPEFRNRLDAIVPFQPLSHDVLLHVVDKFITELEVQLQEKQVVMTVDKNGREWLAKHGYDEKMGARPMMRVIQENIKKPLANEILFGKLVKGGKVNVTARDDKLEIEILSGLLAVKKDPEHSE